MSLRVATLGVLALLAAGCVGSTTPYRPYIMPDGREPRPVQEIKSDPIRDEVEFRHGVPHDVDEESDYITITRREQSAALERVHRNDDGSLRNAWNAYATDMNATLGAGTVREAPKPIPKDQLMLKKSEKSEGEGEGEGGGGAPKMEKPEGGGDKGMEGGEKKE